MSESPRTPPRRPAPALGSSTRSPGTPWRRKTPPKRTQGVKPRSSKFSEGKISDNLKRLLRLEFEPDPWQAQMISKVLRGYDSIFCAGTGYGKSLVFQGLAVLGGKKKVVIVKEAESKGIKAVMINEDNSRTAALWTTARTEAQMIYISPEMAQSESFAKLWKDHRFRDRLQAVIIDEAHCVDERGAEDFRGHYRRLSTLRHYTGHEIPFVACTATCSTSTFDVLWDTLSFGLRPFWGIDVGADRPNLLFVTRALRNPQNPLPDFLNILPTNITNAPQAAEIPKSIIYIDSEPGCHDMKAQIRKCLPAHLRDTVYAFPSGASEAAKKLAWERFRSGRYRILCATDAAGVGCNVPDIRYIVILKCPRSLSVVAQRWGRAGRHRTTQAVCLLLVPQWAFRPPPVASQIAVQAVQRLRQSSTKVKPESK
ncbi:P-loop containing nucleoside triphosphate hydrolase protein [Rhodofomes roseus]|uniref:DNA 3'-5' helicase n=1 Tax=Rhodofomes roseus TaxID=34475 RepID=A0ABQ8JY75_9APHY|nr:P-loop containing nucleoside triphosphate hydrolase protein [Rhodofomes roseus]KAH9828539.1 P-loop containing nucleoside triphosphate hydrolase protein [Rhodofomes roseus]